jgi:hypothetical protein
MTAVVDAFGMPSHDALVEAIMVESRTTRFGWLSWPNAFCHFLARAVPALDTVPSWLEPLLDALLDVPTELPPGWEADAIPLQSYAVMAGALACLPSLGRFQSVARPFLLRLITRFPDADTAIEALATHCQDGDTDMRFLFKESIIAGFRAALVAPRMHVLAARSRHVAERETVWAAQRAARPHAPDDVVGAGAGARSARDGVRPRLAGGMTAAIVRAHLHG